jgi:hypothetical protein
VITVNGKSQDIPWPLCRAAIVVGPAKEGIQKKPSLRSPLKIDTLGNIYMLSIKQKEE